MDLGENFSTHIFLQNLASIQLITSLVKFARSPRTYPPGSREAEAAKAGWKKGKDADKDVPLTPGFGKLKYENVSPKTY